MTKPLPTNTESLFDIPVEPVEQDIDPRDLKLWDEGRDLRAIVFQPGWEVALELLQRIVTASQEALSKTEPWSPTLQHSHAIVFAQKQMYDAFVTMVDARVNAQDPKQESVPALDVLPK